MSKTRSSGRMSNADKDFIRNNYAEMTTEQMAEVIDKTPEAVKRFQKNEGLYSVEMSRQEREYEIAKQKLFKEKFWAELKSEFADSEIPYVIDQYCEHFLQFEKAAKVVHTEKMQLVDLIRNQILLQRSMRRQKLIIDEQDRLLKEIERLEREPEHLRQKAEIKVNKETYMHLANSHTSHIKEYNDIQTKIEKLRLGLKSTRDQRIEKIGSVNTSFAGFLQALDEETIRAAEGEYISIFRAAMERERARLSDYHTYADGELDIPLLTPENVKNIKRRLEEDKNA